MSTHDSALAHAEGAAEAAREAERSARDARRVCRTAHEILNQRVRHAATIEDVVAQAHILRTVGNAVWTPARDAEDQANFARHRAQQADLLAFLVGKAVELGEEGEAQRLCDQCQFAADDVVSLAHDAHALGERCAQQAAEAGLLGETSDEKAVQP